MSVIAYIKNIYQAAVTIFDGLTVTFSYLFQKPVTIQYPNAIEKPMTESLPEGYRGFLEFDEEKCTVCGLCEKACPVNCIFSDGVKLPGRRGKAPVVYSIDLSKCMFCGLCVDACATNGLFFSKEFEAASYDIEGLVRHYVPEELGKARIEEAKRIRAEAEAAAKAAQAEKAAASAAGTKPEAQASGGTAEPEPVCPASAQEDKE